MATNGASLDVVDSDETAGGQDPEEVLRELIGRGMSEGTAQRFVDRAVAENASAGSAST